MLGNQMNTLPYAAFALRHIIMSPIPGRSCSNQAIATPEAIALLADVNIAGRDCGSSSVSVNAAVFIG